MKTMTRTPIARALTTAALLAGTMTIAAEAQAARSLVVDIEAQGSGLATVGSRVSSRRDQYTFSSLFIRAVLPLEGRFPAERTDDGLSLFAMGDQQFAQRGTLSATGFALNSMLPLTSFVQFAFNGTACFDNPTPTVLPNGRQQVDPGCGSFTAAFSDGFAVNGYEFSGTITSIVFSQIESNSVPSIAVAIPEPESWALMVAGFGLAGYALRRRRARVALA